MAENILDTIIKKKKEEVEAARKFVSTEQLERSVYYSRGTLSMKKFLNDGSLTGIIAEFKRKSPSKGVFNSDAKPEIITRAYADAGASGLSILTDESFFGGSNQDLTRARSNAIPILRKDFIIDEYQLIESKSIGADVILLIAACLTPEEVKMLALFAKKIGLEVLLEIHDKNELLHLCDEIDMVGVNNRDLKTFTVDVNRSIELSKLIPADKMMISESGISKAETIVLLRKYGFKGFLIGETFMKEQDPGIAFARFVHQLKTG